jgi:hypothetical protein
MYISLGKIPIRGFEDSIFKIWKKCDDDETISNKHNYESYNDNDKNDNINDINKIRLNMYTTDITQSYLKKNDLEKNDLKKNDLKKNDLEKNDNKGNKSIKIKYDETIDQKIEKFRNKLGIFLDKWYQLSVFSDIKNRIPGTYKKMIEKRISEDLCIDTALRYTKRNIYIYVCI